MTSLLLIFVILILTTYIGPTSLNLTIGLSLGKKYVTQSYLKYLALYLGTLNVHISLRDHNQYRAHVLCLQIILEGPNLIPGPKFLGFATTISINPVNCLVYV